MTRREFDLIVGELEQIQGKKYSQKWADERFEIAKSLPAGDFRRAVLTNAQNGGEFIVVDVRTNSLRVNNV